MEKGKSIDKLPEGWIWTTIGEIAVYPVAKLQAVQITQEALETSSARLVPANTLLLL